MTEQAVCSQQRCARTYILRTGPAWFVEFSTRPGPACLLPAGGFTILRLAHVPNTPTSQVTTDS